MFEFLWSAWSRVLLYISIQNFIETHHIVFEILQLFNFQDGSHLPSSHFYNLETLMDELVDIAFCIIMRNFVEIGQTVAEIWWFIDLSRWQWSAILDLVHIWTTNKEYLMSFIVGCDWYSSFENMKVWTFSHLVWKCLFTLQNYGFRGMIP